MTEDGPFSLTIEYGKLAKGLRPNAEVPRDSGFLVECKGMVGRDEVLSAMDALARMEFMTCGLYFPYPQIFILTSAILVCTSSEIYEWENGAFVLKFTMAIPGNRWHLADFNDYVYLSNSQMALIRDVNKVYSVASLPTAGAICNMNGQILIAEAIPTIDVGFTSVCLTSRPYPIECIESASHTGGGVSAGDFWSSAFGTSGIQLTSGGLMTLFTGARAIGLGELQLGSGGLMTLFVKAPVKMCHLISLTSKPYPVECFESAEHTGGGVTAGDFRQTYWPPVAMNAPTEEAAHTGGGVTAGEFRQILRAMNVGFESAEHTGGGVTGGAFRQILRAWDSGVESAEHTGGGVTAGDFRQTFFLIEYTQPAESAEHTGGGVTGGSCGS